MKTKPTRSRVVTFRVSEEEYADLTRYAAASRVSLAEYLRNAKCRPNLTLTSTDGANVTWGHHHG